MEIILKKSKITSSILKQTLRSTEFDLKEGRILGWCVFNKLKYIVCYREGLNSLSTYPLFKEIESNKSHSPSKDYESVETSYLVKVKLGGNYVPLSYSFKTEKETEDFIQLLKDSKRNAERNGQFFI